MTTDHVFGGSVELEFADAPLQALRTCERGVEIPLRVSVRIDDVLVAERVDGLGWVPQAFDTETGELPPGQTYYPSLVRVRAGFDPSTLVRSMLLAVAPNFALQSASVEAAVTPFGSRGSLGVHLEPDSQPVVTDRNSVPAAAGFHGDVLGWPEEVGCLPYGEALTPASPTHLTTLEAAIDGTNAGYAAAYVGGDRIDVMLTLQRPPSLCEASGLARMLTEVEVRTSDGRMSVRSPVLVELSRVTAPLTFRTRAEGAWTYTRSEFEQRFGNLGLELAPFDHVGVYIEFVGATRAGAISVLGFHAEDCAVCDAEGCACSMSDASKLLDIIVGDNP